ncbi:hypothetical protein [Undibacterium flavidum]|uniref:Uncharacterized protein n=1 Tax=Undibacterium flavidum TaxID=2762297 RepID=A0ABR6YA11_9BURK|nr:hypothetical protein [Undibacterium flavidum]MBC3873469.1 hypothetical protein [Undibacterium flavidum]
MSTPIAAVASSAGPLTGQKARASNNFTLLNGGQLVVSAPVGVVFSISQDKSGSDPTPVSDATNGTVIESGKLSTNTNYYIASPKNAAGNFVVTLSTQ